jgi:hypothetical protein
MKELASPESIASVLPVTAHLAQPGGSIETDFPSLTFVNEDLRGSLAPFFHYGGSTIPRAQHSRHSDFNEQHGDEDY